MPIYKKLRSHENTASDIEVYAAALQYIRKVSGYRQPSRKNEAAFELAISEVAEATRTLLESFEANVQQG